MSRVLFVSTSTTVGGAEKTLFNLATLLDHKAFTVAGVVSLKPEGEYGRRLREAGVKVESLGAASPRPRDAKTLAAIIDRERPDVVHALMFSAIQVARMAKTQASVAFKLVSSPRVNYRTRSTLTLAIDRWQKDRDDLLIAECQASADFLVKRQGYSRERVKVIRNGIETAGWPASKVDRAKHRLELRLGANDLLVGAVGRLDDQKGFDTLIEAMAGLKSFPIKCVILGEGPARGKLEGLVRKHQLEKSVWLLGERADVPSWLSAFDVYCLPSRWEGLPNALLEAMALGLPVVASAVDGVPEAVEHEKSGLLVPPDDPKALGAALRRLVTDFALRGRLGPAAAAVVAEKFTLRRMIAEYEETYRAVLGAP
ncbi:MAG: glycosyltransferase [Elusimicrobiota bacterium]|nr:glycosyltransferase [Elusimicrobiota bacterium]